MSAPVATALVSTWSSERYLAGCLDDLLQQSLGDRLEILVIDACSPEREGEIVRAYQQRHANIRYVRSPAREGTSAAFNRGTELARGRYLSTANTDDRHHPEFFARLVDVLERHPQFGLAYADTAINRRDNETWQDNTASLRFRWPDYTPATALSCCLFGCQPVWRRSVHAEAGPWNVARRHANDQDMFLRIARHHGAVHVREVLGLFLQRPDSVAGSGSRDATLAEALEVFREHRTAWPLKSVFPGLAADPSPFARAAALFEFGNLCALGPYTDGELALHCWQTAVTSPLRGDELATVRAAWANNTGCVLAGGGLHAQAAKALRASGAREIAMDNERRIAAATARGVLPRLRDLRFVEIPHPVVAASRTTCGIEFDAHGLPVVSGPVQQVPWDVFEGPNGVPFERPAHAAAV